MPPERVCVRRMQINLNSGPLLPLADGVCLRVDRCKAKHSGGRLDTDYGLDGMGGRLSQLE
jgi:hypothetical protein